MSDRREAYNALMKFYPLTLDNLPDEHWIKILDDYQLSVFGRVKSFKRYSEGRILKPTCGRSGYLQVCLYIDGEQQHCSIHRLVAEAFIPNPDGKSEVNHIDGCPLNNHVNNLEWCTRSENAKHAANIGLQPSGANTYNAKLSNADVLYIRGNPDRLTQDQLATKFGVSGTTISNIQRGKKWRNADGVIRKSRKHRSNISAEIRDEVCRLYKRGVSGHGCHALAKKFNVSTKTICDILRRWSNGNEQTNPRGVGDAD